MSDQTINYSYTSLKELNQRLSRLRNALDRLEFLAYRQKHIVKALNELSAQCLQFIRDMEQVDVIAFELSHEFIYIRAIVPILINEEEK